MATVVKTMNGFTRYSVRCRGCKARWIEAALSWHTAGAAHRCEQVAHALAQVGTIQQGFLGRFLVTGEKVRARFIRCVEVTWRWRPDATECNAKCQGARGPSCDCRCAGQNHGAGSSPMVAA